MADRLKDYMVRLHEIDEILAQKVMGWELWQDDWYLPCDTTQQKRQFCQHRPLWRPTADACSAQMIWVKCLAKARDLGYELVQEMDDDRRFHINGHHPTARRLLVIDPSLDLAICRFAAELFDFEMPHPYDYNPS